MWFLKKGKYQLIRKNLIKPFYKKSDTIECGNYKGLGVISAGICTKQPFDASSS